MKKKFLAGRSAANLLMVLSFVFNAIVAQSQTYTDRHPPTDSEGQRSLTAFELYHIMLDQAIDLKARPIQSVMSRSTQPVSFGAEKEGSSWKIALVASPRAIDNYFAGYMENFSNGYAAYDDEERNRPQLVSMNQAINFILATMDGSALRPDVDRPNAAIIKKLAAIDWQKHIETLRPLIGRANLTAPRLEKVMSEIFPEVLSGLKILEDYYHDQLFAKLKRSWIRQVTSNFPITDYDDLVIIKGEPSKYIDSVKSEVHGGWEIIFKPQSTYADFEKQIAWFRETLGTSTELFDAPGHNRIVLPSVHERYGQRIAQLDPYVQELNRSIQAFLYLDGIESRRGTLFGNYTGVLHDMPGLTGASDRGVIRVDEPNRFYQNSVSIEFRSGMKDEETRRVMLAVYTSRMASQDMSGLAKYQDYQLMPLGFEDENDYGTLAQELGVSKTLLTKALQKFGSVGQKKLDDMPGADECIPLWLWENTPYGKGKSAEIKRLRRQFIKDLADLPRPQYADISRLMSKWVSDSKLLDDVRNYIVPKRQLPDIEDLIKVSVPRGGLNVNKIPLGNEFTARFPIRARVIPGHGGEYADVRQDMTPQERNNKILSLAQTIKENLTGSRDGVTPFQSSAHGHDLGIAFQFKDNEGGPWRIEWDGIVRDYDEDGNVARETTRGGHMEIVSPKYVPTMKEVEAVYDGMTQESVIPDASMGGSHINIDLKEFDKNPKALARFLQIFHANRGMIAFMFQHPNRVRSAEPIEVSDALANGLARFRGNDKNALATLLYENHYFNSRQNRKTRYAQIDMTSFMAAVIPRSLISPEIDIVKARKTGEGWVKQFRVTPANKMEMRLFDAPRDAIEQALQIKIVRAMMNLAFNGSDPITAPVQEVNYEKYANDPKLAYADLEKTVKMLKLDYIDYSPYVTDRIFLTRQIISMPNYIPWKVALDQEYPKVTFWGRALETPREPGQLRYSNPDDNARVRVATADCETPMRRVRN